MLVLSVPSGARSMKTPLTKHLRKGGAIAGGQVHGRGHIEWLTPPELIKALGDFDLDPCSPVKRPWDTAKTHFTIEDDGLSKPWFGRVWLNPPYDDKAEIWLKRLADHRNGIALIFARTDTRSFHDYVWGRADAVLFIKGRVQFYTVDGIRRRANGAPSVLAAYGESNVESLQAIASRGKFINLAAQWDEHEELGSVDLEEQLEAAMGGVR